MLCSFGISAVLSFNIKNSDAQEIYSGADLAGSRGCSSLDSRPRRERRPGIPCMCMRKIIDSNFTIQIVKKTDKVTIYV